MEMFPSAAAPPSDVALTAGFVTTICPRTHPFIPSVPSMLFPTTTNPCWCCSAAGAGAAAAAVDALMPYAPRTHSFRCAANFFGSSLKRGSSFDVNSLSTHFEILQRMQNRKNIIIVQLSN